MTNTQVYVLADTSYNSEGVDEVAAQHVNADCVVRFGPFWDTNFCGRLELLPAIPQASAAH